MKKTNVLLLLLACCFCLSCTQTKQEQPKSFPMFWSWLDYRPSMNFDSVCVVMKEAGLDGVILNAPTPNDYRVAIPIAHKHGLDVYAWLWTMNLEHDREQIIKEHPEWFSVNRKGESLVDTKAYVDYYKFMCPALPEVREHIKKKIKAYCEVEGLDGIAIDYHRFVDIILPTTLWPKYGIVQDREYPEWDYGYHPEMLRLFQEKHGYDPREQEDPSTDELWLQFRCDQITEVANEIADVVHSYGKVMAASPFPTPAMSRKMVRQDWGKWKLDVVFPMVYHNFYTEDVSFIEDCTIDNVKQKNEMTTLFCGMTSTNGPEMFACMDAALNNGAEGIAIFTISGLRSPEVRKQFRNYTDSVRSLRATSTVNPAATGRTAVNINPFENQGIMKLLDYRLRAYVDWAYAYQKSKFTDKDWSAYTQMARAIHSAKTPEDLIRVMQMFAGREESLKPYVDAITAQRTADSEGMKASFGEYTLSEEYGATKHYLLKESNSNMEFDVVFYFYGDVISGWDVMPTEATKEKIRAKRL